MKQLVPLQGQPAGPGAWGPEGRLCPVSRARLQRGEFALYAGARQAGGARAGPAVRRGAAALLPAVLSALGRQRLCRLLPPRPSVRTCTCSRVSASGPVPCWGRPRPPTMPGPHPLGLVAPPPLTTTDVSRCGQSCPPSSHLLCCHLRWGEEVTSSKLAARSSAREAQGPARHGLAVTADCT